MKENEPYHQSRRIPDRLNKYLSEFVYGGMDGSITTFAVVAGAEGAHLSSSVIIILGFANLLADGLAMSVGSYLSSKSERDDYKKHQKTEYWEVENIPEAEREEIRQIYRDHGFEGDLLERVVDTITEDKDRWVNVMMKHELEMIAPKKTPVASGAMTFLSFVSVGLIPLLVYVLDYFNPLDSSLFGLSITFTTVAFTCIGYIKTYITETSKWKGIVETVLLGALAACVAYLVGSVLENFFV